MVTVQAPHMTAIGVRSLTSDNYVVGIPWIGTNVTRSAAWHSIAILQTDEGISTLIDNVLVSHDKATPEDFTSMLLQTGHMIAGAPNGTALWDALMMFPVYTNTSATAIVDETIPAYTQFLSRWTSLSDEIAPTARQGHTMTSISGSIYLFGGERSGYMYSDLWKLDCKTNKWKFMPVNGYGPAGRYSHAAAAVNDTTLCVISGRGFGMTALDDVWCINVLEEPLVWHRFPSDAGFKGRQGHSAVSNGTTILVFGGFVTEDAALTSETWLIETEIGAMQNLGPLTAAFTAPSNSNPTQGIIMPQAIPEPRMEHGSCFAHGKLWVIGGSTGVLATYPASDVWALDVEERTWQLVYENKGRPYFNGGVVCKNSAAWLVHGGNERGTYSDQLKRVHFGA
jgi:hypothetical protein